TKPLIIDEPLAILEIAKNSGPHHRASDGIANGCDDRAAANDHPLKKNTTPRLRVHRLVRRALIKCFDKRSTFLFMLIVRQVADTFPKHKQLVYVPKLYQISNASDAIVIITRFADIKHQVG
ncbi:hypothetical protein, partial [Roseiconus lacunae]|uniref:hypothetical protein n=1 Tax=Roseiconus lacunae TaxID=2605694 RepID=UPI001F479780